jgi:hypothetical protein
MLEPQFLLRIDTASSPSQRQRVRCCSRVTCILFRAEVLHSAAVLGDYCAASPVLLVHKRLRGRLRLHSFDFFDEKAHCQGDLILTA